MVDVLRAYLNRGDFLHDLREARRQLVDVPSAAESVSRSVKTIRHERGGRRRLSNGLTGEQVRELVAAFEAGTTLMELAERYGIGRSSVAKLLRAWREGDEPMSGHAGNSYLSAGINTSECAKKSRT